MYRKLDHCEAVVTSLVLLLPHTPDSDCDVVSPAAIKNSMLVNEPEIKRQDLDHVFLRFGRSQH